MQEFFFEKTLIIGLGLIGGSFAIALKNHKISKEIFAFDLNYDSIESAKKISLIDGYHMIEDDLSSFDFVVVAVNLEAYKKVLPKLFKNCPSSTVIIDLGSVKNLNFCELPVNFVACHPIAGSEKSGFSNARAEILLDKKFIICPRSSQNKFTEIVEKIVRKIGSKPDFIDAKTHDKIFALTSHLPQFLSFCFKEFSPKDIKNESLKTAFRLDNSSPEMWQDIFTFNQKNLQFFYEIFFSNLENLFDELPSLSQEILIEKLNAVTSADQKIKIGFEIDEQDISFLKKNFAGIAFRLLVALALLKIADLPAYSPYFGSGFKDFISITQILGWKLDFDMMMQQNLFQIKAIFDKI